MQSPGRHRPGWIRRIITARLDGCEEAGQGRAALRGRPLERGRGVPAADEGRQRPPGLRGLPPDRALHRPRHRMLRK